MLDSRIYKDWSLHKITRFVAYLADRVVGAQPRPKTVRDAVWRCHQAAAGRTRARSSDLSAAEAISEAYSSPAWQFVAHVLAVAYWTATADAAADDRARQKEYLDHVYTAADAALDLAQQLGVGGYDLAELYLGMNYGTDLDPHQRDAALAALVAGHPEVADDILQRAA